VFTTSVSAAGHFSNACANCKWRNHGARCSGHVLMPRTTLAGNRLEEVELSSEDEDEVLEDAVEKL
jgi:hypothetical protein